MFFYEILKAILFGIVEGVTEWLPISSTGHLILLDTLLSLRVSDAFYELFEVVVQLGAILAVLLVYRRKLFCFDLGGGIKKSKTLGLWSKIAVGVIPSALIGYFLDDWLDTHFYNYRTVAATLIIYGIVFIAVEYLQKAKAPKFEDVASLRLSDALKIGVFQSLALIPGTSRSGATILGGILIGATRSAAAEFSFFLAIPTMLGASSLKTVKYFVRGNLPSAEEILILAVGAATAFLVSLIVINLLTDFVRRHSFVGFGIYRIILGLAVAAYFMINR